MRCKWARFLCVDFNTKDRVKVVQAHAMKSFGEGAGGGSITSSIVNLGTRWR